MKARSAIRIRLSIVILLASAAGLTGAEELDLRKLFQEGIPPSTWMAPVQRHAEAWLAESAPARAFDHDLVRVLYLLKGTSNEARFAESADRTLRALLEGDAAREVVRPWLLWGRSFELDPERARRLVEAAFPLASAGGGDARPGSPRTMGFALRAWAEAHRATGDAAFLAAIEAALAAYASDEPAALAARGASPAEILSFAIDCDGAARRAPPGLRGRLARLAARLDGAFLSAPHDLRGRRGQRGFARAFAPGTEATPLWDPGAGGETTARLGVSCASRYENGAGVAFRDLATAAAEAYLDRDPAAGEDVWPQTLGNAITLELAAFRFTARDELLRRAIALGDLAQARFYDRGPLPRASLLAEGPSSATGAGTLALALVELHLTVRGITAVRAPANTAAR